MSRYANNVLLGGGVRVRDHKRIKGTFDGKPPMQLHVLNTISLPSKLVFIMQSKPGLQ